MERGTSILNGKGKRVKDFGIGNDHLACLVYENIQKLLPNKIHTWM
jgi:hypothetical protein